MNKTPSQISEILYNLDPMSTGCVENSLTDEYANEAERISFYLSQGRALKDAIVTVFDYNFWENCLTDDKIKAIMKEMTSINNEKIMNLLTEIFDEVDPLSIANENPNEYRNLAGFTVCNYGDNPEAGIISAINKSIVELFFDDMILTQEEEKLICQKLIGNLLSR